MLTWLGKLVKVLEREKKADRLLWILLLKSRSILPNQPGFKRRHRVRSFSQMGCRPLEFWYREDVEPSRGKREVPADAEEIEKFKLCMANTAQSIATYNCGVEHIALEYGYRRHYSWQFKSFSLTSYWTLRLSSAKHLHTHITEPRSVAAVRNKIPFHFACFTSPSFSPDDLPTQSQSPTLSSFACMTRYA